MASPKAMSRREEVWERKRQAFLARRGDVATWRWLVELAWLGGIDHQGRVESGNEVFLLVVEVVWHDHVLPPNMVLN
jgi:hypothetical protein